MTDTHFTFPKPPDPQGDGSPKKEDLQGVVEEVEEVRYGTSTHCPVLGVLSSVRTQVTTHRSGEVEVEEIVDEV